MHVWGEKEKKEEQGGKARENVRVAAEKDKKKGSAWARAVAGLWEVGRYE
jgi:hypothetical protein